MNKIFNEKQIHILNVAEELIARKGFEGTSVRDIAGLAGVNPAMISYYFGSKEKMMTYLYQYRVQRTRENFSEFSETIKDGRAEMQMKEIIKFIVSLLFRYNYFHGFVTQELRHNDTIKEDMLQFYQTCAVKIDDVIKKGVTSGVFRNAPKPEDIITNMIGSALFVIRNRNFYELYLPDTDDYLKGAEKKVLEHLLVSIFAYLDYTK